MAWRWDLEWRTTALTVLLLPVLVSLGFWQLERADEKTAIADLNDARATAPPQSLERIARLSPDELAFRQTEVSGYFYPDVVILLDNQIRDGRYGVDVLGVFTEQVSGLSALVNRGWVPADPARRSLPDVDVPAGLMTLKATVYVPPGEPYLLRDEQFGDLQWPLLVQQANGRALRLALEEQLDLTLFPRELRLEPEQSAGFRRDWPVINVSPQKHRGYALQWFTMAAALLLFFVFRSSNLLDLLRGKSGSNDEA